MAKGYWIANMDLTDAGRYGDYQRFVRPFLAEQGGRFLVRGGQQDIVEGQLRERTVIVEFESYERALEVYRSDTYQQGMRSRLESATTDLVIVEGHDEPDTGR
jgi:uncharacterized protein (DUF1330 family)